MAIKLVHKDGDFSVTLDQNDQNHFLVMATENGRLIWSHTFKQLVPAINRYLQGIADECGCYGSNHDEAVQIETLVQNRMPR